MRLILISCFLIVGCEDDSKRIERERLDASFRLQESIERARINAIRMNRPGLVAEAVAQMQTMTAKRFGPNAAKGATIAADMSGVREVGPDKWEVAGVFEGDDKNGSHFKAPFVVSLEIAIGHLMTSHVALKERTYQNIPSRGEHARSARRTSKSGASSS